MTHFGLSLPLVALFAAPTARAEPPLPLMAFLAAWRSHGPQRLIHHRERRSM